MDFNIKRIEILLEKFWNGESTLEEEKLLEDYFAYCDRVEPGFRESAAYFAARRKSGEHQGLGDDFDREMLEKIDGGNGSGRIVSLKYFWRVAAAILIIGGGVALWWSVQTQNEKPSYAVTQQDTYDNPKEALEATKKALFMMSSKFNEGSSEVHKIQKLNEVSESIKNNEK